MKNILLLTAICLMHFYAPAQTDTTLLPARTYSYVEKMPSYPAGMAEYLALNLKYPDSARKNNIEGRVLARFIVTAEGNVKDIHIVKGIGGGCDEEVVRVLGLMGKWSPGMQYGKPVDVYFTQPVNFQLEDPKPKKK